MATAKNKYQRQGGLESPPPAPPPQSTDRDTAQWVQDAAENPAALTAKQRADRERRARQIKLDLSVAARKELLDWIAKRERTSLSQAGNLLLAWAMKSYLQGNSEIKQAFADGHSPARTLQFEWNVQEPPAWARLLDAFRECGDADGDA